MLKKKSIFLGAFLVCAVGVFVLGMVLQAKNASGESAVYSVSIMNPKPGALVSGVPLTLSGVASGINFGGKGTLDEYNVQVKWGDGSVSDTSNVAFARSENGKDFAGTWANTHTYANTSPCISGCNCYIAVNLYRIDPSRKVPLPGEKVLAEVGGYPLCIREFLPSPSPVL